MIIQGAQFAKLGLGERPRRSKFARPAAMNQGANGNRVSFSVFARIGGNALRIAAMRIACVFCVPFAIGFKVCAALLFIGMVKRPIAGHIARAIIFTPLAAIFFALVGVSNVVLALSLPNLFPITRAPLSMKQLTTVTSTRAG